MIDLDRMEDQLEQALVIGGRAAVAVTAAAAIPARRASPAHAPTPRRLRPRPVARSPRPVGPAAAAVAAEPARPAHVPAPGPADVGDGRQVVELLELGRLEEADGAIAAHARRAAGSAPLGDRLDAAVWRAMRALLAGRRDDAVAAHAVVGTLVAETGGQGADDRCWLQRFWLAVHWGDERERYQVLDHCRERAYRFDDMPSWGMLCLLLADMGKDDEAARAFDAALHQLDAVAGAPAWLDVVTNLAEASWLLGDGARAALAHRRLLASRSPFVVVGRGAVCKGPLDRFLALGAAAASRWPEADECFRAAASTTRRCGAEALLGRTLQQWGACLRRRDDVRADDCLAQSAELARRLQLTPPARFADKVA